MNILINTLHTESKHGGGKIEQLKSYFFGFLIANCQSDMTQNFIVYHFIQRTALPHAPVQIYNNTKMIIKCYLKLVYIVLRSCKNNNKKSTNNMMKTF